MTELLQSRITELKRLTYLELSALLDYQAEKVKSGNHTVIVATWKDTVGDGELRIVVQAYRHILLGVGSMNADGFRINRVNEISPLSKDELYDFT